MRWLGEYLLWRGGEVGEQKGRTGKHWVRSIANEQEFACMPGAEGRSVQKRPEFYDFGLSVLGSIG
jgi:hypothetical protein